MSAVEAAVAVAADHGLRSDQPVVLSESWHVLVHLRPYPVVARVTSGAPGVDPLRGFFYGGAGGFEARHVRAFIVLALALLGFAWALYDASMYLGHLEAPRLRELELQSSP